MIGGQRNYRWRTVRWSICCIAMTSFGVLAARCQQAVSQQPASSQQTDQLQQQLQQLKQQYEGTPRDLEQRVGALEQQLERERE